VSKNALVAIIAGAVVVVAILAVLTPTVIVGGGDDRHAGIRVAHMDMPGGWAPYAPLPRGRGPLPGLRRCLEQHGLGKPDRTAPPSLDAMRRALRDCAPSVH
jgi:hypothetical protein